MVIKPLTLMFTPGWTSVVVNETLVAIGVISSILYVVFAVASPFTKDSVQVVPLFAFSGMFTLEPKLKLPPTTKGLVYKAAEAAISSGSAIALALATRDRRVQEAA